MSQYNSRILIKVKDVADWKKLLDIDFTKYGFWSNPFEGHDDETFEINGDWSCFESEMDAIAEAIIKRLPNCLLLGDTTNINVDPYDYIVYYLGDEINYEEVEGEVQWEAELGTPFELFSVAGLTLSDSEKEYLHSFGFEE